jgi:hypothetical protein
MMIGCNAAVKRSARECFGPVIVCFGKLQRVCKLLLSCSKRFHTSPIRAKSFERKLYTTTKMLGVHIGICTRAAIGLLKMAK